MGAPVGADPTLPPDRRTPVAGGWLRPAVPLVRVPCVDRRLVAVLEVVVSRPAREAPVSVPVHPVRVGHPCVRLDLEGGGAGRLGLGARVRVNSVGPI